MNAARRTLCAALVLTPLACGVTFAPGDFLVPTDPTPLAASPDAASPETSTTPDALAPDATESGAAGGVRILLVGGHRDPLAGETGGANVAETLRNTFSADGVLGTWSFDSAPPVAASWTHAEVAAGNLYVHDNATLVRAPFADGVIGAWSSLAIKPFSGPTRPWLLDAHGFLSGPPAGLKATYALPFLPSGELGEWTAKSGTLTAARSEITLAHLGDLVYALGGRRLGSITPADATVEIAKLGPNGDLGNFTAGPALGTNGPGTTTGYPVYAPIVATGPGRIVVLVGADAAGTTGSDVVFVATITDLATGALGGWRTLPKLPAPLAGCAVVVTTNHILILGGQRPAGTSDEILDLALFPDGSYGSAWIPIGKLPAARSGLVAVTY